MPTTNDPLLARLTESPLMIAPGTEDSFRANIQHLSRIEEFMQDFGASSGDAEEMDFWSDDWGRPYNVQDGTLVIPVYGTLLNKMGRQLGRWATGYQYIEAAFRRGMSDPSVQRIAFDIDSGGGMVAGNFELVEAMASDTRKPKTAFAEDHAYSAAYSIATAADEIVVSRSGGVGSVGVVTAHVEYSEALKQMGIKVTFVHAGAHKVEGNAYEKLPQAAKDRMQAKIDRIYGEFVALVATNRGMGEQAVRDTEALTYDASEAVNIGFADRIGSMKDTLADQREAANRSLNMTKPITPTAEAETGHTDEQLQAAVATATEAGKATGATEERARISAILGSDEGKARPKAALSMALKTDLSADQVSAVLGDLPEEKAEIAPKYRASAGTPFDAAMHATGNPQVGAEEAPVEGETDTPEAHATSMLTSLAMARGKRRKQG